MTGMSLSNLIKIYDRHPARLCLKSLISIEILSLVYLKPKLVVYSVQLLHLKVFQVAPVVCHIESTLSRVKSHLWHFHCPFFCTYQISGSVC